jgi:dTDP-3-amino-3,4,6-trideoxy-alpha-D-glucose transaminase
VGCANGLDAIELALRALDVRAGESVLTTPFSAFATTLAILRAGGKPVFADVDEHGLLDLELADQAFSRDANLRTMVPVHLYGRCLNLEHLSRLKKKYQLRIVEDAAQAVGASWSGEPVGSVGQLTATSFYPTKNLGCMGDGGAVLGQDENLLQRCRSLRDYGQSSKYLHVELGLNSRLDEVQAAVMRHAFLPKLSEWTARRREIARAYEEKIDHPQIALPGPSEESVWHLYVVKTLYRDSLMSHLKQCGIQSAIHYPILISEQEALNGMETCPTPRAKEMTGHALSLPVHPYLHDSEIERVVKAVNGWIPQ